MVAAARRPWTSPPCPLPLGGCRVVNLALNVPGPVAAARLQALGATVVKVEPPGGDPLAAVAPAWYAQLTAGQEVRTLDLKTPRGREALERLLADADLLLTAQRPAALARLGLAPAEVGRRFPRLAYVAIVGYPPPRQDEPGHDLTYLAEAGLLEPPVLPRTLMADLAGAERAVSAALALLLGRERGHAARYAEVPLAEAAADWAAPLRHGLTAPGGVLGGGLPLYRCYPAQDGWVALAALEPHFARRLLEALGVRATRGGRAGADTGSGGGRPVPEDAPPAEDARPWADAPPWEDARTLEAFLADVFRRRPAREWEDWARERDLPLTAVRAVPRAGDRPAGG
ncbi:MAG: carnitine dehydratase [Bacillota bacterium]|nr:MAG: carnitine dehydratase [Bacillota bacterium]